MNAPKRISIKMALQSTSRFKVGCVIAKGRRILCAGYNDMGTTHPRMGTLKRLHAEVHALVSPHSNIVGGDAYVCRVMADGTLGLARPCPICIEALRLYGIKTIYFTSGDGEWIKETLVN